MKVLVAGADGTLGRAIVDEFRPHADVVALNRNSLDIVDDRAVRSRVVAEGPQVVINCAAYNAVDAAQVDPVTALKVNALGVRALAHAASVAGATFIHYSTDFVFDGETDRPYLESDPPNPQSVYAISKWLGEWFTGDVPNHYVLRVESLFSRPGRDRRKGSAAMIVERIDSGEEVPVFVDRTVSPTFVEDAAAATRAIVGRALPSGLYHCVNSGRCTWWQFAEAAAAVLGRPARLKPITLESVAMAAPRPRYAALSNAKLAGFGVVLPTWDDALRRALGA
jgi:dTDP-4-dehydrorhamnose reductase